MSSHKRTYSAKSTYLKERVKQTRFQDRESLEPLFSIERYAERGKITGYAHAMLVHRLWSGHNSAFHAILSEPNPELLEEWKKKEDEQKRAAKESEEGAREEEYNEREAWLAASGLE